MTVREGSLHQPTAELFETTALQKSEICTISVWLDNQAAVARAAVGTLGNLHETQDEEAEIFLFESAVTH
jgi:hypothetical protein